jgi:hypothetical protein
MPKLPHEALVQLVRAAPSMVLDLLRPTLAGLPDAAAVAVVPQVTAAELVNLDLPEYRADAVIRVGPAERPIEVFVVEAQGDMAGRKRKVWPHYITGFAVRFDCPVTLVVFALDEEVAAWCAEPIDVGRGRCVVRPLVIGPREIPVITDPAVAAANPELAVLSVAAHGREPGAEFIARAALAACVRLDSQDGLHYADFINAFLGDLARAALRQIMQVNDDRNPFFSQEFRERWFKERSEGEAEGEVKGAARILLKLLRKRWTVPEAVAERVLACQDVEQIDAWSERALDVATLDEVFAG